MSGDDSSLVYEPLPLDVLTLKVLETASMTSMGVFRKHLVEALSPYASKKQINKAICWARTFGLYHVPQPSRSESGTLYRFRGELPTLKEVQERVIYPALREAPLDTRSHPSYVGSPTYRKADLIDPFDTPQERLRLAFRRVISVTRYWMILSLIIAWAALLAGHPLVAAAALGAAASSAFILYSGSQRK